MSERKWAYEPGEHTKQGLTRRIKSSSDEMMNKFVDLVEWYSESADAKRVYVLNDDMENVFFVQLNEDLESTKRVDVYVWHKNDYCLLPQELSVKTSRNYFDYVDSMAEAYEWLEGE